MPPKHTALAYYVSAHGFGHGVRSCDIIRAFNQSYPEVPVIIVSELPVSFLKNRLPGASNSFRAASFDVGMVQVDSVRIDLPATLRKVEALYASREVHTAAEVSFLKAGGIGLVVVDIPAIPLESAALVGIPRVAVGNFGWDWIYSAYGGSDRRWEPIGQYFSEGYSQADLLLRLPFSEAMNAFPRIEDIPLVASPGMNRRSEIAELAGCRTEKKWVLLSFAALEWNSEALDNVESLTDYEFFTVRPLAWHRKNIHTIDRVQIPFADVLASVDGVVSKPGFGIVSECVVNRKPLLYIDRPDFPECRILVEAIQKYLKQQEIPSGCLYRGELGDSLESLWDQPEPVTTMANGGAAIAARRIADFLLS
jgi:L-arabinokinase